MKSRILIRFSLFLITGLLIFSCKKVELERLPFVTTKTLIGITENSVTAYGIVSDLGEGTVSRYGFCLAEASSTPPTIDDATVSLYDPADTGTYGIKITGIPSGKYYNLRSFMVTSQGTVYGQPLSFWTGWLNYSTGYEDIGLSIENTYYDIAIRFSASDLELYEGYYITKIAFVAYEEDPGYQITIYRSGGLSNGDLVYIQDVDYLNTYNWTEVTLYDPFYIDATSDLLVGVYIYGASPNLVALGFDNGPVARPEYSDLLSVDDGISWFSLNHTWDIDRNWNIKAYAVNGSGKEIEIKSSFAGIQDARKQDDTPVPETINPKESRPTQKRKQ